MTAVTAIKLPLYTYVLILSVFYVYCANCKSITYNRSKDKIYPGNCPFSKIIEDIFNVYNKTSKAGIYIKDSERAKIFLSSVANKTNNTQTNKTIQDDLVEGIIASINRIKNNMTANADDKESRLNEAIILEYPNVNKTQSLKPGVTKVKSGIEHRFDIKENNKMENDGPTENTKYVEILTIEPNNTHSTNTTNKDIIEVLKHLIPMFNSTLTKEMHNITIIERDHTKNHSFTATKNVSTIIVTYCDGENLTKSNTTIGLEKDTDFKELPIPSDDDLVADNHLSLEETDNENFDRNLTINEKNDILEAAEYGWKKMEELYSVFEPKLYSMGLWLDDKNPARYVAAFNAPSEDAAKYSRYGYASLQAASKLKELIGGSNSDDVESRAEPQFPGPGALRQSHLAQNCPLRGAPKCPPASKRYRTHDGTCNNLNRPRWGSTMTPVQRFLSPSYSDGIQAPRKSVFGKKLPSAREISSIVHEDQNVENPSITHSLMQWGQFLDHDVTSSSQTRGFNGSVPRCCKDGGKDFVPQEFMHPECLPIAVPPSDPFYGPKGVKCLDFVRSSPAPRDDCALGWREQLNQVSAFIDGSPVYGSSARQSDKLRLFRNGMLQYGRVQQRRPLLPPERKDELCRGGAVSTDCFKSGDARVNEHPGLVAVHIVWLRQHNRMAQELAHLNSHWSDEKIYQETRKIVGAMIQHISYREFLPIVLGSEVMRLFELEPLKKGYFKEYNPKINPSPASSFGSAAFRFGHSLVQPSMMRYDRFHRPMKNNVSLHNELTNPSNIWSIGAVDRLLLGMVNQPIQKRDEFITEELTNHLFQTPHFGFGMDLAAINIQRGRDHGVPPYTMWREPCGLSAITEFEDLFKMMPARAVKKLKSLYRHVEDIDLFTGGMAERPVIGGLVGPTFACIIAQQFSNLRKGDKFWYENGGFESSFTPAQLQQIRRISLSQVLCRTLDSIDNIQPFAFLSSDNPDNKRISCSNGLMNNFDLSPWVEVHSDSNNDISKADEDHTSTQKPKRPKPSTTARPLTTTKKTKTKFSQNKPFSLISNSDKLQNTTQLAMTDKQNNTEIDLTVDDSGKDILTFNKDSFNLTIQSIDDKLNFKNKTRRYDDIDQVVNRKTYHKPNKQYNDNDYDDGDNVQNVQSVVINNLPNKRPYNRPVISVTENIDKYTYLINYVPKPTQSWRQTTRRKPDRDVIKVTYQNYDDTYRRPNNPYYHNRHDETDDSFNSYGRNRPNSYTTKRDNLQSSARSNDDPMNDTKLTDKTDDINPTTENMHKLVTFRYVGTYKGNDETDKARNKPDSDLQHDTISKDFSTYDFGFDTTQHNVDNMKLSTFYHYETTTKPYSPLRPTQRHDDDLTPIIKYYFIKNVLHKYPDNDSSILDLTDNHTDMTKKSILKENYNSPGSPLTLEAEERSSLNKMALLEEIEANVNKNKNKIKQKNPGNSAKTPSVAFEVIPSENSASNWAVYEESSEIESWPHHMPSIKTDPQALKEIPRPMDLARWQRRPGRF